jgi:hypothetical protein
VHLDELHGPESGKVTSEMVIARYVEGQGVVRGLRSMLSWETRRVVALKHSRFGGSEVDVRQKYSYGGGD